MTSTLKVVLMLFILCILAFKLLAAVTVTVVGETLALSVVVTVVVVVLVFVTIILVLLGIIAVLKTCRDRQARRSPTPQSI